MNRKCFLFFCSLALGGVLMAQRPVEASWESLNRRGYPQWFSDAKLGIFIHWGLYSVPSYASAEGYGEWFYRGLMVGDSGRCAAMRYYADSSLSAFEQYRCLTDYWHAELWQPAEWARLFRDAGAQYVLLVTKHHDGYCLWDSPQQPQWNSVVSGPHRNIVAELTEAVRREGLRMGFYYSLPEWTNPLHIWMEEPADSVGRYVEEYMMPQFKELVSRYKPDIIFSDGDWTFNARQLHSTELISWYYNTVGPDAIVNNRWGNGTKHGFLTPEYSAGIVNFDVPWAECRGLGRSFGLNRNEQLANFLSSTELIQHFCLLVANGGGMTLNVGPAADGTIPFIQQERLLDLGKWLQVNGEAIYGTHVLKSEEGVNAEYAIYNRVSRPGCDRAINFDWVRNAPQRGMPYDDFSVEWTGIVSPEVGSYTVEVEADDAMTVVVDGDTLLCFDKNDPARQQRTATLRVKKANTEQEWVVYYHERDLEAVAKLRWRKEGGNWQPVPARVAYKGQLASPQEGWQVEYRYTRPYCCFTGNERDSYLIVFDRPRNEVVVPHLAPIPRRTELYLLGSPHRLTWHQEANGDLHIDLSAVSDTELAALDHAWVFKFAGLPQRKAAEIIR